MSPLLTVLVVLFGGLAAGIIGSLTGLGGGLVIVPLLTLVLHLPVPEAVGVSLFGVIATSTGAAPRFLGTGLNNVRVGLFLQVAASSGALLGALISHRVPARLLFLVFGLVMLYSAVMSFIPTPHDSKGAPGDSTLAQRFRLASRYRDGDRWVEYQVGSVAPAFGVMVGAGFLSALLGIGSGVFKVLAMDRLMRLPFKVSTATSNFMIGMTAATSAGYYLSHGDVSPLVAGPVILGVLAGAYIGAHWMKVLPVKTLRRVFAVVLCFVALDMLLKSAGL
ncbi:MAG TPA: sulfite exporter TauE/SafE family protein [Gammaproteobacteria bacterium]|nr:sulfite exporter TauE/SafE family protein [Gammaproteobacteria bacterium]